MRMPKVRLVSILLLINFSFGFARISALHAASPGQSNDSCPDPVASYFVTAVGGGVGANCTEAVANAITDAIIDLMKVAVERANRLLTCPAGCISNGIFFESGSNYNSSPSVCNDVGGYNDTWWTDCKDYHGSDPGVDDPDAIAACQETKDAGNQPVSAAHETSATYRMRKQCDPSATPTPTPTPTPPN